MSINCFEIMIKKKQSFIFQRLISNWIKRYNVKFKDYYSCLDKNLLQLPRNAAFPHLRHFARPFQSSVAACLWEWKAWWVGLRSGDWLERWGIAHFFVSKISWFASAVCFGSLKCCSAVLQHVAESEQTVHFLIYPAIPNSSHIIKKHRWPGSTGSQIIPIP